jgi:hypothetical protein
VKDVLDDRDQWRGSGCHVAQPDYIGAGTAKGTALPICAETVSVRTGIKAPSLRDGGGSIDRFAS